MNIFLLQHSSAVVVVAVAVGFEVDLPFAPKTAHDDHSDVEDAVSRQRSITLQGPSKERVQ